MIVECVPNFSEGRDPVVISRIASAARAGNMSQPALSQQIRKVEEALDAKDGAAAAEALRAAEPVLARAAQKGIVHRNAASRKISRLTKRVKALAV